MTGPLRCQLFGRLAGFVQEQSDFVQMRPHQVKIKLLWTLKSIRKVNCAQYQINNVKTGTGNSCLDTVKTFLICFNCCSVCKLQMRSVNVTLLLPILLLFQFTWIQINHDKEIKNECLKYGFRTDCVPLDLPMSREILWEGGCGNAHGRQAIHLSVHLSLYPSIHS